MDSPRRITPIPHRHQERIATRQRYLAVAPPADARLTMSVDEVAHALGVSRQVVYEMVRIGQVPALRLGSRTKPQIRIPVQAVFDLLEAAMAAVGQGDEPCQSHQNPNGAKTGTSSAIAIELTRA